MPVYVLNVTAPPRKLPVLNASYPQDVTLVASANGSATFKVSIAEDGKPAEYSYQWYVNGTAVPGATGASYTRTGLTAEATYTVYCAVTNKAGTVNSRTATLTVQDWLPKYTYTGSHKLVNEGNYKWHIEFYTSGKLKVTHPGNATSFDVFACGAGGGGTGSWNGHFIGRGGGGGYTKTAKKQTIQLNVEYTITIGTGGTGGPAQTKPYTAGQGGTTSITGPAVSVSATGGYGGVQGSSHSHSGSGGNGGSGGAGWSGTPGIDGRDGTSNNPRPDWGTDIGGTGQHTTTRAFGETSGKLFSTGGYSGRNETAVVHGGSNTGDGGDGSHPATTMAGGNGGSGILMIRNSR